MFETSPIGVELFSYANTPFCSNKFVRLLAQVSDKAFLFIVVSKLTQRKSSLTVPRSSLYSINCFSPLEEKSPEDEIENKDERSVLLFPEGLLVSVYLQ